MQKTESWKKATEIGITVKRYWQELADRYELDIVQTGIPALANFTFKSKKALEYKTLITQEMLKKGFLASTSFYASTAHKKDIIEKYITELEKVFIKISQCEDGKAIEDLLEVPVCHSGFKRLN